MKIRTISKKFAYEMAKRYKVKEDLTERRNFKILEENGWWNANFFLYNITKEDVTISIWFNNQKEVQILSDENGEFKYIYEHKFSTKKELEKFLRALARKLNIK